MFFQEYLPENDNNPVWMLVCYWHRLIANILFNYRLKSVFIDFNNPNSSPSRFLQQAGSPVCREILQDNRKDFSSSKVHNLQFELSTSTGKVWNRYIFLFKQELKLYAFCLVKAPDTVLRNDGYFSLISFFVKNSQQRKENSRGATGH